MLHAQLGIAWRLNDPSERLIDTYGLEVVRAFNVASYTFAVIVCCLLLPRVAVWACQKFFTIQVLQLDDFYPNFADSVTAP